MHLISYEEFLKKNAGYKNNNNKKGKVYKPLLNYHQIDNIFPKLLIVTISL